MTFFQFLAGLGLVIGCCAAVATAATLCMVGMARLEQSAMRVPDDLRSSVERHRRT